ncbi:MAG TPA: hypothetical protein VGR51_09015 [Thermoplasmata archaeon]|nr:hypothetical protein [Thermoplasmata archaeon]
MPENGGSVRLSVTISAKQKAFLDSHPEYSASGLLQQAIDRIMEARA